jgi:hypothetical protein
VGSYVGMKLQKPPKVPDGPPGESPVAIMRARSYSDDLVSRMLEGIRQCGLDVRDKRVLLKPNLVEFDPQTVINTAATLDMADDAKYRVTIPKFESIFTDLDRDDVSPVRGFARSRSFTSPIRCWRRI